MRIEIKSASNFLTNLLRLRCLPSARLERFAARLEQLLGEHYKQHWFPESPTKGSGYRCIRINHKMDPILSRAGAESGFDDEGLKGLFPRELTLWVDPSEVSYRIGENGSICVLYDACQNNRASTPARDVRRPSSCSSDEDYDSCSSMSISPPNCKETFVMDPCNVMDPRGITLELSNFAN